jgi:hypothetical protein
MWAFAIVMVIAFGLAAIEWARRLHPATAIDVLCAAWVTLVASITVTANALSAMGRLGSPAAWAGGGVICALAPFATRRQRTPLLPLISRALRTGQQHASRSPILVLMMLTVSAVALANLIVIASTAPGSADALAYHLPKMGYALQSGSFDLQYANYWAQQVHPHNGTALLVYAFLATGGNDHWLPIWQYASYWVSIACVAGLAREIGAGVRGALLAGCVFGLLTNALMQSTDAGNDLLLAAHTSVCALMIIRSVRGRLTWQLTIAGLAAGLAFGTKALFLITMPSLAGLFIVMWRNATHRRRFAAAVAAGAIGFMAMAVPSGFVDNYRRWGDPLLGPVEVRRETTFAGRSARYQLVNGTRNLVRYVADSLSADGLPRLPTVVRLYRAVRSPLRSMTRSVGMNLEAPEGTRASFAYDRLLSAHETHAFWGILGVLLLWPALIVGIARGRDLIRALAIGGALIFPLQSYTALYDPWHGRYFLLAAVFLAPVAGWLSEHSSWRRYARAAAAIGCASAVTAVLFRSRIPLISTGAGNAERRSVFRMDRQEQLTRGNPDATEALRTFERLVPDNAVVDVTAEGGTPEYMFFGEHLGRQLHPRRPGYPVPAKDWLLFREGVERALPTDMALGAGFWLRKPVS